MRTPIRAAVVLVMAGAVIVVAGCTSMGAQAGNPLVPADTARDTINKANDAVGNLQDQVDESTAP
jgi:hypothetical protein